MPPGPALGLIGGGAALVLAGIGCGVGALATAKTINEGGTYNAVDYQALVNSGQALNSAAIALDVVGGVALAAGAAWPSHFVCITTPKRPRCALAAPAYL